ncbi:SAM-dependent methyltransferase [Aestuariivirga litoralis]|uniref:SAM-dependent methyltransferase n=1 Tax=Aestuariivirga litoralis TaxID=2650924 RepID=UPI0018C51257|nr:cyclopropane-fatty-acyl-phospholipid synthase family protein [Aestuariivirga litoralis]MBG1233567.1 class I SAM-dependent methyltransferase [Aestuariivirga litoralis]
MRQTLVEKAIVSVAARLLPKGFKGSLDVTLPSGRVFTLGGVEPGEKADLTLRNFKVIWASVRRAQLGFFERYLAGDIESKDPTAFFRFYLQNRAGLDNASGMFRASVFDKIWHRLRDNTAAGSKENISAHYDLGNEFYKLWLDDTMSYSSAIFDSKANSLEAAQKLKYQRVLEAAEVKKGSKVLEIGCGWGGFAEMAAKAGASLRGITLSKEQLAFAKERMDKQGLSKNTELVFEDYRDTTGVYDAIASIEMIEAVGEPHWPAYFKTLFNRLKPGGAAAIQGITILEENFPAYKSGVDFIQRYVFPGGMLLTKDIMREQTQKAGLLLEKIETFGQSYAETLLQWRQRFDAAWPQIKPLGFDERFRKLWTLYLCYCEAGFAEGVIDVGIYKIRKPA